MKKYFIVGILLLFTLCFAACDSKNEVNAKDMQIYPAKLSQQETDMFNLMKENEDVKIYEYMVNDTIKSLHLELLVLNPQGQWESYSSSSAQLEFPKGRIAIETVGEGNVFRVSYQDESGVGSWTSNMENLKQMENQMKVSTWEANLIDIQSDQVIPLGIQVLSEENAVSTLPMEMFDKPQELKQYDRVMAVTISFSKESL